MSWRAASNLIPITFTRPALKRLLKISDNKPYIYFEMLNDSPPFNYRFKPSSNIPQPEDKIVPISKRFEIVVPKDHVPKLYGTEIGFKRDIMGSRFVFKNPNET